MNLPQEFHNDEIVLIDRRQFQRNRRTVDKPMEIKKSTMTEMRLLNKLLIAFSEEETAENVSAEDMFIRTIVGVFEAAIEKVTTADGTSTLEHGVKNGFYLLKNSATIVMASHLGSGDANNAAEVQKCIHYLDLNRDTIFADAAYAINRSRQERLRMPEQRTDEMQVQNLQAVRSVPDDQSRELYRTARCHLQQINAFQCT